ncbi:hypothetical protein JHK85_053294 [Glycine max]|nr:hypothetical protein JHK85_053294 [Glycine max]
MARQLVLALIFVAIIGMAMANEAPSASPKASPSPKSSPSSSKSSPAPSAESPLSSPPSPTSSDETDISTAPAPASDPIELYAPEPEPFEDPFTTPEETDPADVTSGASALRFSTAVTVVACLTLTHFETLILSNLHSAVATLSLVTSTAIP